MVQINVQNSQLIYILSIIFKIKYIKIAINIIIASVVQTLLILESNKFSSQTQEFLKDFTDIKVKAIGEFIKKFDVYSSEEIQNLSLIFSEIISKYYLIQDGKEMLEYLCNEESVEQVFYYMKNGSEGSKNGAGQIIQSLAQYYAFNANSFISGYPEGSEYYQIMLSQYENMPFLKTLLNNFDTFSEILSIKDNNAAGGNTRQTLGIHRLKIIEVMNQVIRIQFPSVQEGLVSSNVLQRLLDLFFKFEWHNILHQIVLNILLFIIQNCDKARIKAYLKHLLNDQRITQQFIDQVGDTHFYFDKGKYPNRTTTKGYLGYVIKIADALEKFYEESIKNRTNSDMLDWHNETWVNFVQNTLDNHKEKGCKDLGNFDKFINGVSTPETTAGEDDMAIYREYERQQASERMKQRQSYLDQVELQKFYESKKQRSVTNENTNSEIILDYVPGINQKQTDSNTVISSTTPTGEAQPNAYGVSSLRSSGESILASKQNVMFVQMDSKQLDDDQQMDEEDDEDNIKKATKTQEQQQDVKTENIKGNIAPSIPFIPSIPSLANSSTILTYNSYISDNPLIREIMEKYSPTKGLLISADGGLITPAQPEENHTLIHAKPAFQETQEVIIQREIVVNNPVYEDKMVDDEATILQSQQEGQVSIPANTNEREKTIQISTDIADNGTDQVEVVHTEAQNQQDNQLVIAQNQDNLPADDQENKEHSLTQLDKQVDSVSLPELQETINNVKTVTENIAHENLKNDIEYDQKIEIQNAQTVVEQVSGIFEKDSGIDEQYSQIVEKNSQIKIIEQDSSKEENNSQQDSQIVQEDSGKVDKDPIASSPIKPENIEETLDSNKEEVENKVEDIKELIENKIESVPVSERLNYFMSNTTSVVVERNRSTDQLTNRQLLKKPSFSHSPPHNKGNQNNSPSKKLVNNPFIIPSSTESYSVEQQQIEKVQEDNLETKELIELINQNLGGNEGTVKPEQASEQIVEQNEIKETNNKAEVEEVLHEESTQIKNDIAEDIIEVVKDKIDEITVVKHEDIEIEQQLKEKTETENVLNEDSQSKEIIKEQVEESKNIIQNVIDNISDNIVIQESQKNEKIEMDKQQNEQDAKEFLKESGIDDYQYVLLKKEYQETRNSPLIEQFEHNVQHKMTSLFTSQEVLKNSNSNTSSSYQIQNKSETLLPENVIKVDKADFKTFVFEEESSNFEPINIELDRVYDKEENEQILKSSNNPSPSQYTQDKQTNQLNNIIESLSSLSNFKYEMKYKEPIVENTPPLAKIEEIKKEDIAIKEPAKVDQTIATNTQVSPPNTQSPLTNVSDQIDPKIKQEIKDESIVPALVYDDTDPSFKATKKKFGEEGQQIDNQSRSLPSEAFRKSDEMSQSLNLGQVDSSKIANSSPMKFKQQFQENLRASYDSQSIQRIINQNSNNSNSVEVTPNTQQLGELKLTQMKSADNNNNNTSPNTQKIKFLQQSKQERMQIQQVLLQKYGSKGTSKSNSPQATLEAQPSDPYTSTSQAHQQFSYKLQSPYETSQNAQSMISSQHHQKQNEAGMQTMNIRGSNYTVISKEAPTHSNTFTQYQRQYHQYESQQQQQQQQQQQYQQQYQQEVQPQGMSQAEKLSYVEQETVLVQQKLVSSKDYQLVLIQIQDMQGVYDIISDDNTSLIEQRIITSQTIRQNFFEISENNRLQLEQIINGLEEDKQRQEKELKLQYQTEFEMIERQIRQEQDETKAKKKTQDFLQKLLLDRVNKLYEIHLKYSYQQKQSLEKAILEAKNLNEKLLSMHLLVAPANQLSPERANQILNPPNGSFPIIQPQSVVISQQQPVQNNQNFQAPLINQSKSISTPLTLTKDNSNEDVSKYLVSNNPVPRQYNSMPTNNKSVEEDNVKRTTSNQPLSVSTVKANTNQQEESSNSPCFGKDPIRIPLHRPSEDSNSSDDQKNLMQSQTSEASPCFGNKKSPQRKSSFSQRYSSRKLSGAANTEGEQVQEDPYDYKASSSARDKSPMPNQAAMYHSNSQNASTTNQNSSNDYLRRLTQNTTLASNQPHYRGSISQTQIPQQQQQQQQSYPVVQHQSLHPQQHQQQQNNHVVFDNYQPISPYQLTEEQTKLTSSSNSSNIPNRQSNVLYDSQGQLITQQPLAQDQYSQQSQQRPQYRKIFSQTPVPVNKKQQNQQYGQQGTQHAQINLQQQQPQQVIKQQQLIPNQQPTQQPFLNFNYSQQQSQQPQQQQLQQQQQQQYMKQPDDQYQKISDNLKLSAYYSGQPQVKTIQIDLSKNDERRASDLAINSNQAQIDLPQRANQSALNQKQGSQSFHQQSNSYGQVSNIESYEIENQLQFRHFIPSQAKSSQNTPGNASTPIGSSSNLNYSTSQQTQKELNHKQLSQTTLFDSHNNPRNRPLSQSDIMYKPPQPQQIIESQFAQLSSPQAAYSPQPNQNYAQSQYNLSAFSQSQPPQNQQTSQNPQKSNLLNPDVQQIIYKYTQNNATMGYQNYTQQQQLPIQMQTSQSYQKPIQMTTSEKNISYGDEYSNNERLKNSSTNYSSYSGANGSFYNNTQHINNELSNLSGMEDEASVNSSIMSSQNEGHSQGKKIKIVLKKVSQPKSHISNEQSDYARQQQQQNIYDRGQQQEIDNNQQQLMHSQLDQNMKISRPIQDKDKQFLQFMLNHKQSNK